MDRLAGMGSGRAQSRPDSAIQNNSPKLLEQPSIEALDWPFEPLWPGEQNGVSTMAVQAGLACSVRAGRPRSAGARPPDTHASASDRPGAGRRPCSTFEACADWLEGSKFTARWEINLL